MAKITEDYVSFETAKLLKEKGFDEPCFRYTESKEIYESGNWAVTNVTGGGIGIPTLQMAMKWLREKHSIFIVINIVHNTTVTMEQRYYFFKPYKNRRIYNFPLDYSIQLYETYEQACEAAIKYCLENLI